jgi:hypothetical protein
LGGVEFPAVFNLPGDQDDVAADGVDFTLVLDPGLGIADKIEVAARHELGVADVQGGGDKTSGIDDGPASHDNAVGVNQVNLAVGLKSAQKGRWIAADHAIEGGGSDAGLDKFGELAAAYGKILPVDNDPVAGIDGKGIARAIKTGGSSHHLLAAGIGQNNGRKTKKDDQRNL